MVTKAEMIEHAASLGRGSPAVLSRRFTRYREHGLIGNAIGKERRRGGRGVWHPEQDRLWLRLLAAHEAGGSLRALTNLLVELWLRGTEGIEVVQAQRALRSFVVLTHKAPPARFGRRDGRASRRTRDLWAVGESVASSESSADDREKLYRALWALSEPSFRPRTDDEKSGDGSEYGSVDGMLPRDRLPADFSGRYRDHPDMFEGSLRELISVVSGDSFIAQHVTRSVMRQFRALRNLDWFLVENQYAWNLWEWARWNYPSNGLAIMPACPCLLDLFGMIDFPVETAGVSNHP